MLIYLGGDHQGFDLKGKTKTFLESLGYEVEDFGPHNLNPGDDYPDFVFPVAKAVAENQDSVGIIFGFSGQGEAMQANRLKGVRASVYYGGSLEVLKKTREDNNSNILSLGVGFLSDMEAFEAIKIWLNTDFSKEERHQRRINEMDSNLNS